MIWMIAVFFPLLATLFCLLPGKGFIFGRILMIGAPLPALFLALKGCQGEVTDLNNFLLQSRLGFTPWGREFLAAISIVWTGSAVYAAFGRWELTRSFAVMFLLTMCGNLGLTVSLDAVSFYLFFALMTFCAYPLIIHSRDDFSIGAGRIYLIMAVLGEGLLLSGIMTSVFLTESHYFADISVVMAQIPQSHPVFTMLFAGFGIKAGLIFVHFWLPLAHPAAPVPASAVLSGAMIKAGLAGWLFFFPVGSVDFGSWGIILSTMGVMGALWGIIAGIAETKPKIILAYSSISQMGLMTFCLGQGLYQGSLWTAAAPALVFLVLNHALAKAALFLRAGLPTQILSNNCIILCMLSFIPALSLSGAPFTAGIQAKYLLKTAADTGPFGSISSYLLALSSVFTTILLAHFFNSLRKNNRPENYDPVKTLSWLLMTSSVIVLPFLLKFLFPDQQINLLNPGTIISGLWPVLSGVAIYVFMGKFLNKKAGRTTTLFPDMALLMEKSWYHFNLKIRQSRLLESELIKMNFSRYTDLIISSRTAVKISRGLEKKFSTWTVFGFFFILFILLFIFLAAHKMY